MKRLGHSHPFWSGLIFSGAGVVIAWLSSEPTALLIPLAAVLLLGPRKVGLLAAGIFGLTLFLLVTANVWGLLEPGEFSRLAVFPATALGLSLIALSFRKPPATRAEYEAKLIVESMPGFGWAFDADGKLIYLNQKVLDYIGMPKSDPANPKFLAAYDWQSQIHPDEQELVLQKWQHSLATGEVFDIEHRMRRSDGVYRWFRATGSPALDASGRIRGWYGTTFDIDDRKQAELALRVSEERLRRMIDTLPAAVWSTDEKGQPILINQTLRRYSGIAIEDLDEPGRSRLSAAVRDAVHPDDRQIVHDALGHSFGSGEPFSLRYRHARADGSYGWIDGRAEALRNEEGRIVQWLGVCHDIDEEVLARQALRESERQFRQLVDTVPTLIWCLTPEGEPSYFNKQLVDYCGLDIDDVDTPDRTRLAAIIAAIIHPDDARAVDETLGRSLATGETFALKYRVRRADGAYRWIAGRAEPMRDREGRIQQWYGLCFDIEEEVLAQQALREREKQLRLIIDTVPGLVWSVTPEGEPSYYNKRLVDWGGVGLPDFDHSAPSLLTSAIEIIIHPEDQPAVEEELRQCFATGRSWNMRYRQRRADGVYRWIEGRAEPLRDEGGKIVQWYGLSLDIDDQLRAETALRQSEEQLRRLVDTVPALIWLLTPEGEPSYYNKRLVDWFGINVDGVDTPGSSRIDATIKAVVHPDDAEGVDRALRHSLVTGEPYARRYRLRLNTGEYRWIEARCEPLRDESGAIVQWYGVNLDIEDEMRAEASLRQSERQLRQLVDTVPALIWCLDPAGQPSYYNRRLVKWLGFEVSDFKGPVLDRLEAAIGSIVHPDFRTVVAEALGQSFATGEPFVMKYPQRNADGIYRWTEGRLEALRDEDGAIVHWYGVLLDIEDEVRVQDALRLAHDKLARASQAASLAELSASIAHEVNQPLAAIVANAYACQRWLSATPPNLDRARITAERIIRDANSAADVVSHIRALFQQTAQARSPTDLNQVITEVHQLIADELSAKEISLATDLERDLPAALIDRVQIQQVVLNLLRNGADAMETQDGGERSLRIVSRREGTDMIRVEVQDFGTGIADPDRAFEPFFTTKQDGMGMGLAICRSIIESHAGRIWAAGNAPRGTTLAFTVPVPGETAT